MTEVFVPRDKSSLVLKRTILLDVDDCLRLEWSCENGGQAVDTGKSCECQCAAGYTGEHCETGLQHCCVNLYNFCTDNIRVA